MNEKKETFFRVNPEQYDSLRLEAQAVSPEEQSKFDEVTRMVCEAFVKTFGGFLTQEQRDYFFNTSVLTVEDGYLKRMEQHWEATDTKINPMEILNGVYYKSYKNQLVAKGAKNKGGSGESVSAEESCGQQFWSGRIPAAVPFKKDGKIISVDSKYLVPVREFEQMVDTLTDDEAFASIYNFVATNNWAQIALHEKIHTVLDPNLPLPISECAADGYQKIIFANSHWQGVPTYFGRSAEIYWRELLKEFNGDLSLLAFGNLEEPKKSEIFGQLASRFTPKQIAKIFPDTTWKTKKMKSKSKKK